MTEHILLRRQSVNRNNDARTPAGAVQSAGCFVGALARKVSAATLTTGGTCPHAGIASRVWLGDAVKPEH
jgi:hypothetical protein